jgi:hypothetical protein
MLGPEVIVPESLRFLVGKNQRFPGALREPVEIRHAAVLAGTRSVPRTEPCPPRRSNPG